MTVLSDFVRVDDARRLSTGRAERRRARRPRRQGEATTSVLSDFVSADDAQAAPDDAIHAGLRGSADSERRR